ncbi:MAG: beta-ketoacyl-ACP synthase II [Verrucomicrobia bacterium]|nr:beta-ketoacyl-ACP synthase II [Verrucomicrobiota bacterium]MBV9129368.1 beta-ketoacyl-ACP synthase II [Verrucomicrobiota bacterium]MBV9643489.1 beta-ketoacyl-ACP synthase II [Verrucomicrobiota bacterium]
MSNRRVVVTGIGVVSPIGSDLKSFWENLVNGKSGIGPITQFDSSTFDCHIAGEIFDFKPALYFKNPKDVRRADRFAQLAMASAKLAIEDSGIDLARVDRTRYGVLVGSGIGGLKSLEDQHTALMNKGPSRVSPFMVPMMIVNMAGGLISMEYGLEGPNYSIVTACATAANSIGEAWRMIRYGDADGFLAGGSEAVICQLGIAGFCSMRAMSTRNDEPEKASRPFDRDRDGFVMGEGAGILVLEEYEIAKARGARIYCELAGYGLTSDAYHMTSPRPDGTPVARAMQLALDYAGANVTEVDYINAHATSTPVGDICESNAIKLLAGHHAKAGLLVSSTKSMTGHLLGGAGGVESAACILAIKNGIVPPTINLDNPDPYCDLDYVPNVARTKKVRIALNNSFGFGGHNATLVFRALG